MSDLGEHELASPKRLAASGVIPFGNADWIRQQLRTGHLEGSKVSGRWMTTRAAIEAMVAAGTNSTRRRRRRTA